MSDTTALMKARLAELNGKRDKIREQANPLREKRGDILTKAKVEAAKLADEVKVIEKDLFDINNEIGKLAKVLGGKSMNN